LIAVAFDQAAGDNQLFRRAEFLVLSHFEDRIHGLFLCWLYEATGVYDQNVGFVGAGSQLIAVTREDTHHDLAIHEVFGATQTDKTYLWHVGNCAFSQFSIVAREVCRPRKARGLKCLFLEAKRRECEA
jgi:hypothetical protein